VLAAAVNAANNAAPRPAAGLTKKKAAVPKFDLPGWEHTVLSEVLKITLDVRSIYRMLSSGINP
jgi:hypothetical protein